MYIKWLQKGRAILLAAAIVAGTAFMSTGTAYAAVSLTGSISGCAIASDKNNITISLSSGGDAAGTDGNVYVFELQPYEKAIGTRTDYIASATAGSGTSVNVALNLGKADDRLYSKFVLAAYDGTQFVEISSPHYVTNPEIVAKNQAEFRDPLTKKGLNIELSMLADAFDLGVKHVATNIAFSQIMGTGIDYVYDGKTYHFNKTIMEDYDKIISALSGKSMTVTAIILNDWNDNTPDLVYPGTQKSSSANYYMFNAATQAGVEQTKAIASFLAERYNGSDPNHGTVSNWIIGNEINNQIWNYMGPADINTYLTAYQSAFRLFYTAIKSTSANDRVYFSLDYWWGAPYEHKNNQVNYRGKDIVDTFNSMAQTQGQMDWGLAYHPYPYPMTEPEFWDDVNTGEVTQDASSSVVNFANLSVLTDYFQQDSLKTASGQVRHIILTEEGFSSQSASKGTVTDIQAAAFAYSYYLVDSNPYIDAYILSRQVDAPAEVNIGLRFGLWECDMSKPNLIVATKRKKIWQVFRDIDKKKDTIEATEFAKSIIGINKWSDVIPNFRWRNQEQ